MLSSRTLSNGILDIQGLEGADLSLFLEPWRPLEMNNQHLKCIKKTHIFKFDSISLCYCFIVYSCLLWCLCHWGQKRGGNTFSICPPPNTTNGFLSRGCSMTLFTEDGNTSLYKKALSIGQVLPLSPHRVL